MNYIILIVAIFFYFYILPFPAFAIIFLPALVLIPIAKIVAIIIGSFSLPALGIGVVYTKLFKKSVSKVIFITLLLIIIGGIAVGIYLKIENPARPLF